MKEIACQFGENDRLSGVMTCANSRSKQALVFISVGFETKHGPYRVHVQIARMAAQHGLDSFRFDFGDLGYSQPGHSRKPLLERKNEEIRSALDYIESTFHIKKFVLIGICSAAEDAFRYAALDTRVQGIIMVDTFAYQISRNNIPVFFERLKKWSLRKLYSLKSYPILPEQDDLNAQLVQYNYMKKDESQSILNNLLKRELKLHFIYTNGMYNLFNHKSQLWAMFPELKRYPHVALDYFPTVGHAQMLEEERKCLISAIEKRLIAMHLRSN